MYEAMRIDIHVHTSERSGCGASSEIDQVRAAIGAGFDAVALTDHGHLAPAENLARLNDEYAPFRVFGGIEITVDGEDVLVLGISDPRIEAGAWHYPELHTFVREGGGLLAIAHPFRYRPDVRLPLDRFPPDAIEVYSRNTPPDAASRILDLALDLDIAPLSNSDAHATDAIGQHYNALDRTPRDERELIDMLKQGLFTGVVRHADGTITECRRRGHPPP
jgi:predicted metal-dependent phosphoesterase TrpH